MSDEIEISYVSGNKLVNIDTSILETIIYNSFINLSEYNQLKHNKKEINRLCNTKSSFLISATINDVLIGYILGEYINLDKLNSDKRHTDGRYVCYITYIHVVDDYRNIGVASNMIKFLIKLQKQNIDGIMLTCDTSNNRLVRFYKKLGFMEDIMFRTYSRFETYYKYL